MFDLLGSQLNSELCMCLLLQSVETDAWGSVGVMPSKEHTSNVLIGTIRPRLLFEVCVVLTDLQCHIVKAEVWSDNTRVAAIVRVTDESTVVAIEDLDRLSTIRNSSAMS
ncbi:ACT-like protein [Dioscorea alata]|uniref:ACT-like protein n=1 Tax=Dioscorea alata TaxID=55571 RepID=A0ACB7WSB0_DIOAL|nr:ACT-like protein [Dioscorea alata]